MRLDPPPPFVDSNGTASKSPPLFRAQTATVVFSAEKDGKLRARSPSLGDEAKVIFPGEVMEVSWGAQGVEARIVPAIRRGPDLAAAIDRASDPYDGDPDRVAKLQQQAVAEPNAHRQNGGNAWPNSVAHEDLGFPGHTL